MSDTQYLDWPFFTHHHGDGLGLAFVSRIIKEMGGKISVESDLGKGSVFNVSLPVM